MITLTINGQAYSFPETGDKKWGNLVTVWASAATNGLLQKSGGLFQLTSELDFGSAFGIVSIYFKSRSLNPSSTGVIRLSNTDSIGWRNIANSGNLLLTPSGVTDGILLYNSIPLNPLTTNGDLYIRSSGANSRLPIGLLNQVLKVSAGGLPEWANQAGGGDVTGPGSSTDNVLVRWNGITGTMIKNTSATATDTEINQLSGVTTSVIESASNLGASGSSVFKQKTSHNLEFRKLIAGSGIILTENANDITIVGSGGEGIFIVEPSEGGAGIEAALEAAKTAGGGVVQLRAGTYSIIDDIEPLGSDYMCGVTLRGVGPETVLSIDVNNLTTAALSLVGGTLNVNQSISNVSAGDTSITFSTASNAGTVKAGDRLIIAGTDNESLTDVSYPHEAAADGNPGTGVVMLVNPIMKTFTSTTCAMNFPTEDNTIAAMNNAIEDLTVKMAVAPLSAAIFGIRILKQQDFKMRNIVFEGFRNNLSSSGSAVVQFDTCLDPEFSNIRILGSTNEGILYNGTFGGVLQRCNIFQTGQQGAIVFSGTYDHLVDNHNVIVRSTTGINFIGSNLSRRIKVDKNFIKDCTDAGIASPGVTAINDSEITLNVIEKGGSNGGIYLRSNRMQIIQNQFYHCALGIYQDAGSDSVIANNTFRFNGSYAVYLQAGSGHQVEANKMYGGIGGDSAIVLAGISNNKISSNFINGITGKGISLTGDSDNNLIDANKISGTSSDAINIGNSCDNNLISLNHCVGLTIVQGTGTGNDFISNKV